MSSNDLFVKPASDKLLCRHPNTGAALPLDGAYWPDNPQTRRAIRCGDIVEAEPEQQATPAKSRAKKGAK